MQHVNFVLQSSEFIFKPILATNKETKFYKDALCSRSIWKRKDD